MAEKKQPQVATDSIPSFMQRIDWWRKATFGMFIHYGLYSLLGRHEWIMNRERIPLAEYEKLAAKFTAENFDPRSYARLAREAGMKYVIMTTKHHEGFCLFDTALTDYKSVNSAAGRDLIREFADAVRAEGLGLGFYYSMMDWHHPDGARCLHDEAARQRFVEYTHGQVRELMSNYGKVDILWYDVPWPLKPDGWDSLGLNYMVRSLQPHILINNRSLLPEDFGTPEQKVEAMAPYRAWEACLTMNDTWCWNYADHNWKSVKDILGLLVQSARGGGNLLMNIGPKPDGTVPQESVERLQAVGKWLERHGEAIYAMERARTEWNAGGVSTVKGNVMYYHCRNWFGSELTLGGIESKVRRVWLLTTGQEVDFTQTFEPTQQLKMRGLPEESPDEHMAVIAIECEGSPRQRLGAGHVWLDGVLPLEGAGIF